MTPNVNDGFRPLHPGMGQAVAERTVLRKKSNGKFETWGDVANRVATGNSLLCPNQDDVAPEQDRLRYHIANASLLMSGRHLQHGDEKQPERNMEVFTNCSTSATSFLMFYLLLNGSGVGRCYDDDMMVVDWDNAPNLRVVLDENHADFDISAHESVRDARHKYGTNSKKVMWFEVPDSREGWAKALEFWELAAFEKVHKDKMLILDFSRVRPKGSPIGGMQDRPASGPVPLMNAFMKAASLKNAGLEPWRQSMYVDHYFAECVLVGGARRSARMSTKYWKDPSVIDFIEVKRPIEYSGLNVEEVVSFRKEIEEHNLNNPSEPKFNPYGFLWSSNNSVTVDEEFWNLLDIKRGDPEFHNEDAKHARKVWKRLVECSYGDGTGEPGIINVDKLVHNNTGWDNLNRGDYVGFWKYTLEDETEIMMAKLSKKAKKKKYNMITNPCVTADTWIDTTAGPKRVADLIGIPFKAMVNGKSYQASGFWKTGEKPVFRVKTSRGHYIRATDNHQLLVNRDGQEFWIEVKDLSPGDKLVLDTGRESILFNSDEMDRGWLLGQMVGDGGYNPTAYKGYVRFWGDNAEELAIKASRIVESLPQTYRAPRPWSAPVWNKGNGTYTIATKRLDDLAEDYIRPVTKEATDKLESANANFVLGFLGGLFDADGSIQGDRIKGRSIRLAQSNLSRLEMVQRMLQRFGIYSTIYKNRREAEARMLPNGTGGYDLYECQAQHELMISRSSMGVFSDMIQLRDPNKENKLKNSLENQLRSLYEDKAITIVTEIVPDGMEAVYDCTVDEVHRFSANGIIAHNCGEVALNVLGGYCVIADVVPFHANTLDEAEDAFRVATRALMRVNMMESLYKREVKRTNRIGVGMTGVHEFAWKFFKVGFLNLVNPDFDAFKEAQQTSYSIENLSQHEDPGIRSAAFWMCLNRFNNAVHEEGVSYAEQLGVNAPHTETTIKPAGTTSKLFGLTEGWHLPSMAFYTRWVQFRHDDPLVKRYADEGYPTRHLKVYDGTTIVGFPTAPTISTLGMGDELVTAGEATPEDQYKWLHLGEKFYIRGVDPETLEPLERNTGNQISYTLKYKPDNISLKDFRELMRQYQPKIRACSIMPQEDGSSYEYQPEEAVTKAEYEAMIRTIRTELEEDIGKEHVDCASGACPVDFSAGSKEEIAA